MKRAIITGASGFVGANLARRLLACGHEVFAFVRPGSDLWRLKDIEQSIKFYKLVLADEDAVAEAVSAVKADWIFHLAVHGAYSWQTKLHEMIATNMTGTANLLEACVNTGFEAFVNTGSSSEYGFKDHAACEEEPLDPNSYYAVTKAGATFLCRYIAQSQKLHVPTLRLYSVYGPYEDPRRLIPTMIMKGLAGKLPVLVDETIARDYIYIDDVIDAYLLAAAGSTGEPGAIYNVGTGCQTTMGQLVEIARQTMEISEAPVWGSMPNRIWDSSSWVAHNQKIKSRLGWSPKYSVAEGFRSTLEWFRENPSRQKYYEEYLAAKA